MTEKTDVTDTLSNGNHSVKEPRLGKDNFKKYPTSIYFYYLKVHGNKTWVARHFFYDQLIRIQPNQLPRILEYLFLNAQSNQEIPPEHGDDLVDIVWHRKSYVAFMADSSDFSFQSDEAMTFDPATPNLSFFDSKLIDTTAWRNSSGAAVPSASGIIVVNHMKRDEAGNDMGYEEIPYTFQLHLGRSVGTARIEDDGLTIDSGGTNTGPPVRPPAPLGG